MKIPRDIDANSLIKVISSYGYSISRQVGSHIRLENKSNGHKITIPNHDPIKIGTLNKIVKDICSINNLKLSDLINKL